MAGESDVCPRCGGEWGRDYFGPSCSECHLSRGSQADQALASANFIKNGSMVRTATVVAFELDKGVGGQVLPSGTVYLAGLGEGDDCATVVASEANVPWWTSRIGKRVEVVFRDPAEGE